MRPIRAKAITTQQWPWLNRVLAAWLLAMLALCLGVLAFAAVREMSIECRREPSYVTTVNGDPLRLVDGISRLELIAGSHWAMLSPFPSSHKWRAFKPGATRWPLASVKVAARKAALAGGA